MQILTLLSRGSHPPRQPEPPLSDGIWELIQSCWVREASKRPGIEEVTDIMISQSMARKLAAQHPLPYHISFTSYPTVESMPSNQVSAQTSVTALRPESGVRLHMVPDGQLPEKRHACTMCHKRWARMLVFGHCTKFPNRICAGRRYGAASSLNRHMRNMHPPRIMEFITESDFMSLRSSPSRGSSRKFRAVSWVRDSEISSSISGWKSASIPTLCRLVHLVCVGIVRWTSMEEGGAGVNLRYRWQHLWHHVRWGKTGLIGRSCTSHLALNIYTPWSMS